MSRIVAVAADRIDLGHLAADDGDVLVLDRLQRMRRGDVVRFTRVPTCMDCGADTTRAAQRRTSGYTNRTVPVTGLCG
jgi:hypothetical protein